MAGRQGGAVIRARTWLFWVHLAFGLVAGAGIFTMSLTGALLALQPQILDWLERDQRLVAPPLAGERLAPSALLSAATRGEGRLDSLSLRMSSDPGEAALVTLGRNAIRYVDPYSGTITGEGVRAGRRAFQWLTEFHRWLATSSEWRRGARAVTGWSTLAFVVLILSGLVLWIPRSLSGTAIARAMTPGLAATTKARHFNWHTVAGFWCSPVLLVLASTGVVLAFPWANRLLYTAAGSPTPATIQRTDGPGRERPTRHADAGAAALPDYRPVDEAWGAAVTKVPTWRTIVVRIPSRAEGPLSFTITDAAHWNRFARSQMTVSGATGAILRWEPYGETTRGQRWRGLARFAHTGELGGLAGQVLAGVASAGAALLVWTGMSLAVRRLVRSRSARPGRVQAVSNTPRTRTPVVEPITQAEQG